MNTTEIFFKARAPLVTRPSCNEGGFRGVEDMVGMGLAAEGVRYAAVEGHVVAFLSSHYPENIRKLR